MIDNAVDSFSAGRSAERADFLAYLRRRLANAATMAGQKPELCEYAEDRRRQLEAVIDEVGCEMHVGEADVAAAIEGGGE